jgi:tetratricopeptide (TPR) repeat protein
MGVSTMNPCTDEKLGHLIALYETENLSEKERIRFEEHMLDCEFCRRELAEMNGAFSLMQAQRDEILAGLRDEGIDYASRLDLLSAEMHGRLSRESAPGELTERLARLIKGLFQWEYAASMTLTAAAVIFLVFLRIPPSTNPYLQLVTFATPSVPTQVMRDAGADEARRSFNRGMDLFNRGNYKGAAYHLGEAAFNDSANGTYWLYSGMSQFLRHRAAAAIAALTRAEQLTEYAQKNRARWYLAQSYLLMGNPARAVLYLKLLRDEQFEYSEEAAELLAKIEAVPTHPNSE